MSLSYVGNRHNHKTEGGCLACKRNESADPGDEAVAEKFSKDPNTRETGKATQEELRGSHF